MSYDKIPALRKRKGWSQEQLAEESGLSLRTIQRIENGESEPTGHSLRQLTRALGISPDELMEWAPVENRGYVVLLNLAALGVLFHPMLGIILPLAMWILKRDEIRQVDATGRKLMSFMITWVLVIYAVLNVAAAGQFIVFTFSFADLFFALFVEFGWITITLTALYLYVIVIILVNAYRVRKGQNLTYVPAIPFLR